MTLMTLQLTNRWRNLCCVLITLTLLTPAYAYPSVVGNTLLRQVTNTSKAGLAWASPSGSADIVTQYETTSKVSWCVCCISVVHDHDSNICCKISRYYTWSPSGTMSSDLEFVPMLWGQRQVDQFTQTIQKTIAGGNVKAVLGMNECVPKFPSVPLLIVY